MTAETDCDPSNRISYQWYKLGDWNDAITDYKSAIIPGATDKSFSATEDEQYRCYVSVNGETKSGDYTIDTSWQRVQIGSLYYELNTSNENGDAGVWGVKGIRRESLKLRRAQS